MHHRYKFKMYKEIDKFHQDLKCLQYIHVLNYHTVYLKLESESLLVMSDSLRPLDYTVHGILQARIREWVAIPFSRGSS